MTIALVLRVNEGVVLAADSATTLTVQQGDSTQVANVYNNANKVFNLYRGAPIGVATWGQGFIRESSISMLMKDLRAEFMNGTQAFNKDEFKVETVAHMVKKFVFDDRYVPAFAEWPAKPELGLIVAGISSGETIGEEYAIVAQPNGAVEGPTPLAQDDHATVTWFGQIEAITRLVIGFSPALPGLLQAVYGIDPQVVMDKLPTIRDALNPNVMTDTMPLQDAIDLAHYLVDVAIRFSQYAPGANVVGGEIEVAAMSKHEGFKWISRKHYYQEELNPHHLLPTEEIR